MEGHAHKTGDDELPIQFAKGDVDRDVDHGVHAGDLCFAKFGKRTGSGFQRIEFCGAAPRHERSSRSTSIWVAANDGDHAVKL